MCVCVCHGRAGLFCSERLTRAVLFCLREALACCAAARPLSAQAHSQGAIAATVGMSSGCASACVLCWGAVGSAPAAKSDSVVVILCVVFLGDPVTNPQGR